MKCCGVLSRYRRDRAALLLRGANRSEHGNYPGLPGLARPARGSGLGPLPADRPGRGEAAMLLLARESPAHGKGGSGFEKGRRLQYRKTRRRMAAHRIRPAGPWSQVAEMQAKLYGWAAADPGRRFDDLFNFVHDPATLYVADRRVEGNRGANTPGVDVMTVRLVEQRIGVREFLDDLRAQLKAGTLWPLPVRERKIPQGGRGPTRWIRYAFGQAPAIRWTAAVEWGGQGRRTVRDRAAPGPVPEQEPARLGRVRRSGGRHSPLDSALTIRGVQAARPTLYALTHRRTGLGAGPVLLVGDENEGCLKPALMLKRTIPGRGPGRLSAHRPHCQPGRTRRL